MEQEWGEGGGTAKDHRALFPFNTTCYHYFLVLMPSVKTDSWKVEVSRRDSSKAFTDGVLNNENKAGRQGDGGKT